MQFVQLETLIRRAPLGLRFLDLARGTPVTNGLKVAAWPIGAPLLRQVASRSPLSGIYGFRNLSGLRRYAHGEAPASEWCAAPADGGTLVGDETPTLEELQALVSANTNGSNANFALAVGDTGGRFLPQVLLLCLPKEQLVEVPLFSAPSRPPLPGAGLVRGEAWNRPANQPARWALITISPPGGATYVAVTDGRGMFTAFLPYASPLPPLNNGQGSGALDQLTWPLTIRVLYQPSQQRPLADLAGDPDAPPDTRSVLEQAAATMRDGSAAGAAVASITRAIRFGSELVVTTGGESRLLVEPA
ncbi:MAG: hypothetical protein MUD01_27235 [Chloroflexaceae bacterium]|jgi:hypothetical protein|nr:hypothetical protein [Chloroflexaceae bacterium]